MGDNKPSRIYHSPPDQTGSEGDSIKEVLASNWIAPVGPHLLEFERAIESFSECSRALATNSCTAALHLGLELLNVGPEDIVLLPSHSFIASAHAVSYCRAEPVFIDSESVSGNMDPDLLVKAIQSLDQEGALSRVKAIMVVHAYGWPAEMDRIIEISKSYGIPLIEDAAESLGAKWRGKSTGTFGQFGAYSFNGNKIITTSGGGALLCPDEVSYAHALFLATQAKEPAPDGMQGRVGYNYRLSNVLAALGTAQIKTMEQRMDQRRANRERYRSYFSGWTEEMSVQFTNGWAHGQPNYWMTNVFFKKERWRSLVEDALEEWNIECRRIWKPIHLMASYSASRFYSLREAGSVAQDLFELGTSLPSGSSLSEPDWKRIFHALDQAKHEIERSL